MRTLLLGIAALGIGCVAPNPIPSSPTTPPPVVVAAEFAMTTYVEESTRTHGVVCLDLDRVEDGAKVLERLAPLAKRLSVDRNDCLGHDASSAILSIGPPQVAGEKARVDVGVVRGSAGMLELERRQGSWLVVRATSPWLSLR